MDAILKCDKCFVDNDSDDEGVPSHLRAFTQRKMKKVRKVATGAAKAMKLWAKHRRIRRNNKKLSSFLPVLEMPDRAVEEPPTETDFDSQETLVLGLFEEWDARNFGGSPSSSSSSHSRSSGSS